MIRNSTAIVLYQYYSNYCCCSLMFLVGMESLPVLGFRLGGFGSESLKVGVREEGYRDTA